MCGRYSMFGPVTPSRQALNALEQMGLDVEASLNSREAQFNIAPTQLAPVVVSRDEGAHVEAMRWGLVPGWAKDKKIGAKAINARVETVVEKPMFRSAFKKRRCLVPASGYFEWREEEDGKQPYFIHGPDDELLMFAGLWELWRGEESDPWLKTFTILTGEPGKVSGNIHDRQPVILSPDLYDLWLTASPEDAVSALAAVPTADLEYYPVTKAVGSPRNSGPEVVRPLA